ncbi:hypothetical protein TWF718_007070 [Orbilia javanica]|uniref:RRM domain-containing protein n=1 Tax=Orbilia javanica TaxID=47235 RepID=A0AAN8MY74_9PEZI
MSSRSGSMPPNGLGASRWAEIPDSAPPGPAASGPHPVAPRPEIPRLAAPVLRSTGDPEIPRFPGPPVDSTSALDSSLHRPSQLEPIVTATKEPTKEPQTNLASEPRQIWHHTEETGTKVILHFDGVECMVRGMVKSKDGTPQDGPAIRAICKLSVEIDKTLAFGGDHELVNTEKGGSMVSLGVEGDGRSGQGPALKVVVPRVENERFGISAEVGGTLAATRKPFPPTSKDFVIDLTKLELEGENGQLPKVFQKLSVEATGKAKAAVKAATQSPTVSEVIASSKGNGDGTPSRSVVIVGLPYEFTVKQVLDLIKPTTNTRVIEIKITKEHAALLSFLTPAGAEDFLSQWESGFVTFPYEDEGLGKVEWRSRVLPWGTYVPIKPESLCGYIEKGATRYLRIRGRNPITIREANLTWSLDNYRHCLGNHIYDGHIYRDDQTSEVAELEFLSVARAVSALHSFKPKDGFARATFTFLPDKYVLI